MYTKLKQDMRNANVPVSAGNDLLASDMQLVRDFLYFNGINLGEEFHRYEEVVHGTIAVAAAPADTSIGDGDGDLGNDAGDAGDVGGDGGAGDIVIGDAGDPVIGDTNEGGENTEGDANTDPEGDQAPDQDQV